MKKKREEQKDAPKEEEKKNVLAEVLAAVFAGDADKRASISLLILDRSGSMSVHCQPACVPKDAVNAHLRRLKDRHDGHAYFAALLSFADDYKLEIPLGPVGPELQNYSPDGYTLLFSTVYHGMRDLLEQFRGLSPEQQKRVKVTVGVLSDGQDNKSDKSKYPQSLRTLAYEVTALGWETLTFGIGINGQRLAQEMGFMSDSDHAYSLTNESASIVAATERFTGATVLGPIQFTR